MHIYGKKLEDGVDVMKSKSHDQGLKTGFSNQSDLTDRAVVFGEYILEKKATVRDCAKHFKARFGISKSTVHKDVSERLPKISPQMYPLVKEVLDANKKERHIRGGQATKHKYEELAMLRQKDK